jgi:hypothetical protein
MSNLAPIAPTTASGVTWLTAASARRFVRAEKAMVLLVRADCRHCAGLVAALQSDLSRPELRRLNVGVMAIDRPEGRRIRCDNRWLGGLDVFPYLVRYRFGRRVAGVPAARVGLLLRSLAARANRELDPAA